MDQLRSRSSCNFDVEQNCRDRNDLRSSRQRRDRVDYLILKCWRTASQTLELSTDLYHAREGHQRRIVWDDNDTPYHIHLDDVLVRQVPEYPFQDFGRKLVYQVEYRRGGRWRRGRKPDLNLQLAHETEYTR